MKLVLFFFTLVAMSGCTLSINLNNQPYTHSSESGVEKPVETQVDAQVDSEVYTDTIGELAIPPLPTITKDDLKSRAAVERKLVEHIGELRTLLKDYVSRVKECQSKTAK